MISQRSS